MIDTRTIKILGATNYKGLLVLTILPSPTVVLLFRVENALWNNFYKEEGDNEALTLSQEARDALKREFSHLTPSKQHSLASKMGLLNDQPMQCVKQEVVMSSFYSFVDDDNTFYHKIRLDELLPETFKLLNTKHEN